MGAQGSEGLKKQIPAVVDGDVLADITLLEDRSRFIAVMQGCVIKAGQLTRTEDTWENVTKMG